MGNKYFSMKYNNTHHLRFHPFFFIFCCNVFPEKTENRIVELFLLTGLDPSTDIENSAIHCPVFLGAELLYDSLFTTRPYG